MPEAAEVTKSSLRSSHASARDRAAMVAQNTHLSNFADALTNRSAIYQKHLQGEVDKLEAKKRMRATELFVRQRQFFIETVFDSNKELRFAHLRNQRLMKLRDDSHGKNNGYTAKHCRRMSSGTLTERLFLMPSSETDENNSPNLRRVEHARTSLFHLGMSLKEQDDERVIQNHPSSSLLSKKAGPNQPRVTMKKMKTSRAYAESRPSDVETLKGDRGLRRAVSDVTGNRVAQHSLMEQRLNGGNLKMERLRHVERSGAKDNSFQNNRAPTRMVIEQGMHTNVSLPLTSNNLRKAETAHSAREAKLNLLHRHLDDTEETRLKTGDDPMDHLNQKMRRVGRAETGRFVHVEPSSEDTAMPLMKIGDPCSKRPHSAAREMVMSPVQTKGRCGVNIINKVEDVNLWEGREQRSERLLLRLATTLPTELLVKTEEQSQTMSDVLGFTERRERLLDKARSASAQECKADPRFIKLIDCLSPQTPKHNSSFA